MYYVDVHTHLTHKQFQHDCEDVIQRAIKAQLGAMVVNGLEPESNRRILDMATRWPQIKPALGIYPLDAINHLNPELPFPLARFDVDAELTFIREQAKQGKVFALGECGLDGHWVGESTFAEQERVFEAFIAMALEFDLPLIIHTRKRELRAMEILRHHQVKRVNFHCYGGKVKAALDAAHNEGWWFSIPANARHSEAFTKMLKQLPESCILTETDAPYLSATKGHRSEPADVVGTVQYLAELKGWKTEQAQALVYNNFQRLFAHT